MKLLQQVHKVGAFNSEKQLSSNVQAFFTDADKQLLVIQCSAILDAAHILLTKYIIDKQRQEYKPKGMRQKLPRYC
jgi:hypothetical protein